jgi:hypothetical protein
LLFVWAVITALVAALSLGPSFAHVLEAAPRLGWSPELWREATVFNGQFWVFAAVGAPLDVAAIACPAVLAFMLRGDRPALWCALGAVVLNAAALGAWFALVKPMNDVLATWTPGPVPADFEAVRWRWEAGHMAVAGVKAAGFTSLVVALLLRRG